MFISTAKSIDGLNSDIDFCIKRKISTPSSVVSIKDKNFDGRVRTTFGIRDKDMFKIQEPAQIANFRALAQSKRPSNFENLGLSSQSRMSGIHTGAKSTSTMPIHFQKIERKKEILKMKIPQFHPFEKSEETSRTSKLMVKSFYNRKFNVKPYQKKLKRFTGADNFHPKRESPYTLSNRPLKKKDLIKSTIKKNVNNHLSKRRIQKVIFKPPPEEPLTIKRKHIKTINLAIPKVSTLKQPKGSRQSYLRSLIKHHDSSRDKRDNKPLIQLFNKLNVIRAKSVQRQRMIESKRNPSNSRNYTGVFQVCGLSCDKRME
ncbi:unnamed protein product [Moneuplotes crassus]|uniref:Uncharacterized protein n=1 Tax=Euplotes crassus TaxID=5936 RepID=A0AAD1XCE7_EUPCR|nr:unnamed protein product [Moneuplotes crassus]